MTTQKQIEANRLNALKGGVKTEAGKAVSKMNALTHGLFTKNILLPDENGRQLEALRRYYLAELQPEGEMETLLFELIVSCTWRWRRAVQTEKKNTPRFGLYDQAYWQYLMRYETALERKVYKAHRELRTLQAARLIKQKAAESSGKETLSLEDKVTRGLNNLFTKNPDLLYDD